MRAAGASDSPLPCRYQHQRWTLPDADAFPNQMRNVISGSVLWSPLSCTCPKHLQGETSRSLLQIPEPLAAHPVSKAELRHPQSTLVPVNLDPGLGNGPIGEHLVVRPSPMGTQKRDMDLPSSGLLLTGGVMGVW